MLDVSISLSSIFFHATFSADQIRFQNGRFLYLAPAGAIPGGDIDPRDIAMRLSIAAPTDHKGDCATYATKQRVGAEPFLPTTTDRQAALEIFSMTTTLDFPSMTNSTSSSSPLPSKARPIGWPTWTRPSSGR